MSTYTFVVLVWMFSAPWDLSAALATDESTCVGIGDAMLKLNPDYRYKCVPVVGEVQPPEDSSEDDDE